MLEIDEINGGRMRRLHLVSKDRQSVTNRTEGPRLSHDGRVGNCKKSRLRISNHAPESGKLLRTD